MFNRQFTKADGCLVQVTPIGKTGMTYREYVFDQSGRMMVFNSISGPYETSTSQKTFFLLPARIAPRFEELKDRVVVTMADGSRAIFTEPSRFVDSFEGPLQARDLGRIDLSEGGNFELISYSGIYIDAGWKIGNRSYRDPEGFSKFYWNNSLMCRAQNSEIFVYVDPVTREPLYQPMLKLQTRDQLRQFIANSCH